MPIPIKQLAFIVVLSMTAKAFRAGSSVSYFEALFSDRIRVLGSNSRRMAILHHSKIRAVVIRRPCQRTASVARKLGGKTQTPDERCSTHGSPEKAVRNEHDREDVDR